MTDDSLWTSMTNSVNLCHLLWCRREVLQDLQSLYLLLANCGTQSWCFYTDWLTKPVIWCKIGTSSNYSLSLPSTFMNYLANNSWISIVPILCRLIRSSFLSLRSNANISNCAVKPVSPNLFCVIDFRMNSRMLFEKTLQEKSVQSLKRKHINFVKVERLGYERKIEQGCLEPKSFMSLVIDGADQNYSSLPHAISTKYQWGKWLKMHLICELIHEVMKCLIILTMKDQR